MRKRLLILASCFALMLGANAQNRAKEYKEGLQPDLSFIEKMATKNGSYSYKMSSYATDDNYLSCNFSYDQAHRLVAVRQVQDYEVVDSLFYDSDSRLIKLSGWQKINGQFENVYYVDYTYDAAGNLATRTNYNYFDAWELGGVYTYSYNADNQIIKSELTMSGIVFMCVDYTYVDGKLNNEVWSYHSGTKLEPAEKIYYFYQNDKLVEVKDSTMGTYGWELFTTETYVYDAQGNCIEKHRYDSYGDEVERSVYEFETRLLDETLMPSHFEMERPYTYTNVNTYSREHWYTVDDNFVLQYVCDYVYNYVSINDNGISSASVETFAIVPNPAKDRIMIESNGLETANIQVVDAMGRVVITANISPDSRMVDISSLASGYYLLRVVGKEGYKISKLVVQ